MIHFWNLSEAAAAVRCGKLDPRELLQACFAQIDQWEDRLHAWVLVDRDGAMKTAEDVHRQVQSGDDPGSLAGIPVGVKDIIDVEGWPTRAGSDVTSDAPSDADAPVVARLRAAGAIILGKTVTTEFACFDPPPTRNPWNIERTPGGSSSGSAVAVATGMCLGAIGSQTGGSITRPASYCGIAGMKPSFGRISREGVYPVSASLDHVGPMAATVRDLWAIFHVLADDAPPAEIQPSNSPPRLGLLQSYFMETASDGMAAGVRAAMKGLAAGGATTRVASLPDSFDHVHAHHQRIMAFEAAQVHRDPFAAHRDRYGPNIAALLEHGLETSHEQHQVALSHQRRFRQEILASFDGVDALVTPATPDVAPGLETTGDPRFNAPFSYSGLPTVSFPCGMSPDGLPLALQLVGKPGGDEALLTDAAWCEDRVQFGRFTSLHPRR